MRRIISFLLILSLMLPFAASAESSSSILNRAVAALHKSKSLTAGYTISSGSERTSGTITVEGMRFKIKSPDMLVWFDGKTQWTLVPSDAEVNISEPSRAELQQVNPFAVIDSHAKVYTSVQLRSSDPSKTVIELKAKNTKLSGGIQRVVLTLDKTSLAPEKLVITFSSHSVVTITISGIKGGAPLGEAAFRPSAAALSGVDVIDLR